TPRPGGVRRRVARVARVDMGGVSRGLRVRRVVHRLLADRRGQCSNPGPGGTAAGRAALGSPHRAAHGMERIGGPGRGPGGTGDSTRDGAVLSRPPTIWSNQLATVESG